MRLTELLTKLHRQLRTVGDVEVITDHTGMSDPRHLIDVTFMPYDNQVIIVTTDGFSESEVEAAKEAVRRQLEDK